MNTMNAIREWVRKTTIIKILNYLREAKNAIAIRDKATDWARGAESTIIKLKRENLELRQPDLEYRLQKNAEAEARQKMQQEMASSRSALLKLPMLTIDELRHLVRFEVWEEDDGWAIGEAFCQFGGCTILGDKRYETERQALEYAYIRTSLGEKPSRGLCAECSAEYREMII